MDQPDASSDQPVPPSVPVAPAVPEAPEAPIEARTAVPLSGFDAPPPQFGFAQPQPAPASVVKEFESVTDLGIRPVYHRDRIVRGVQLFACRNLL